MDFSRIWCVKTAIFERIAALFLHLCRMLFGCISEDLREDLIHSLQKYVEVDEPEPQTAPVIGSGSDDDSTAFDTMSEDELLRAIESLAPPERRED
jgi:hypothetical protein